MQKKAVTSCIGRSILFSGAPYSQNLSLSVAHIDGTWLERASLSLGARDSCWRVVENKSKARSSHFHRVRDGDTPPRSWASKQATAYSLESLDFPDHRAWDSTTRGQGT